MGRSGHSESIREKTRPASDFDTPERNVPGRAEGDDIITVPDTFFAEFGTLVPGDVIQGELQIDNRERPAGRCILEAGDRGRTSSGTGGTLGGKGRWCLFSAKEVLRNNPWGNLLSLKRMNKMRKKNLIFFLRFPEDMDNTYRLRVHTLPGRFGQCQRILRFR